MELVLLLSKVLVPSEFVTVELKYEFSLGLVSTITNGWTCGARHYG